jgi:cytochrome c553
MDMLPGNDLINCAVRSAKCWRGFIKFSILFFLLGLVFLPAIAAAPPQQAKDTVAAPPWAYGFTSPAGGATSDPPAPPPFSPVQDDGTMRQLPGSTFSYTRTQIQDSYGPADWYPSDHPQMPEVVAHGRQPDVRACSLCHYPNGKGRPENAGIAGLPYSYFVHTMNDFKNGARKSADGRKPNTYLMIGFAKAMSEDEIAAAARYFSSMKWTPWIKVVETSTVPKTHIGGGMFLRLEGDEKEPIGQRIIETPVNTEATEVLRDPRSGFLAYVPVGSLKRGEDLVVKGGAGQTTPCGLCHGEDLTGLGPVPGIAGRSPSYLMRQLVDIQQGSRNGEWTSLMKPVVSQLTPDDLLAVAAYLASREP